MGSFFGTVCTACGHTFATGGAVAGAGGRGVFAAGAARWENTFWTWSRPDRQPAVQSSSGPRGTIRLGLMLVCVMK
ncbi:hypothetical protein GCM10023075_75410 [Streptosporangium album]